MSRDALVTGASRGVGAATFVHLAKAGDRVRGVYKSHHEAARGVLERAAHVGQAGEMVAADLGRDEGRAKVRAAVSAPLGAVVFNAGIAMRAEFSAEEVNGVDPLLAQLRLDLEAPLQLCRGLLRDGRLVKGTNLVFVSSNLARHGLANKVAYAAAKSGLEGAVRGLAHELGPKGIRVNAVAPGLLRTDMTSDFGDAAMRAYEAEVPLRRAGSAEDVAQVIAFLLGEGAAYISGQILDVDGGWGA